MQEKDYGMEELQDKLNRNQDQDKISDNYGEYQQLEKEYKNNRNQHKLFHIENTHGALACPACFACYII